jgi:outer membrane receptor protein involved in Fe transport
MISRALAALGLALAAAAGANPRSTVSGVVTDATGAMVAGAEVSLRSGLLVVVRSARSDGQGAFAFADVVPGSYLLVASARGLAEARLAVRVGPSGAPPLAVVLHPAPRNEEITVTASPGRVDPTGRVSQPVNVIDAEAVLARARAVVAQVASEEAGLALQRTSSTMGGVFVRGLTGNKVSVFVDGVRYSTSAARGGVNTFLSLIDPGSLDGVEVLRGPSSAQYGSDAIGGSVQFLTRNPRLTPEPATEGSFGTSFGSADAGFGSELTASHGRRRFGLLATLSGRRINTLRPGGGRDSHNAVTRFLGLDSDLAIAGRLPDTAFTQFGGLLKLRWAANPRSQLVASYARGQQDGGKRYDQLLGGDGNLVADLRNLMLDRVHVKYEHQGLGVFDRASLGYSFGAQREERVNQGGNGNPRASINHEYEKTRVHGAQGALEKQWGGHALALGGDFYHERVTAPSFGVSPLTNAVTARRGRVPDQARYDGGGVYAQDAFDAVPERLRLLGNLRWSRASYESRASRSPTSSGRPLWPDDSLHVSGLTFRLGAVLDATDALAFTANVSRGYRAPHVTDLGTLGLTGAGFEVAAPDVAGLGATVGSSADRTALSTGDPVRQLGPETSLSYEASLRFHRKGFRTDLTVFQNDIADNIQKQALVLPPGAVGLVLGDQAITSQTVAGVVFVPASPNPVLVRANFDRARIWGIEHTLSATLSPAWSVAAVFTYLHAEDRDTGRPPNVEGGTPAPEAWLKVRWRSGGRRFWVEPYLHLAGRQGRLSSLDLEDRRTGATRSRDGIASFFDHGARARGWVDAGPDGVPHNGDDVLLATGETLGQVQDRVLGPGVAAAPLFNFVAGYAVAGVRAGWRAGSHQVVVDAENLGDRNYRGISWGMDAPGRGVYVRYAVRF